MTPTPEQGMRTDMDVEATRARELVLRVIAQHADSLLKTARRHSLCADDAQDAYQRTMEIFMRRAATLDPERAHLWVHTVCKHEAMAVRAQRQQLVAGEEPDLDRVEARHLPSPEERLVSFERLRQSAEALQRLKPQELRALWLKAEGFSYEEICRQTGWTYTKVNRCITEGRRAFLARYERIDGGDECERWLPLLSAVVDGEATPEQLLEVRPHLRNCTACRATIRRLHETDAPLAALFPVALAPGVHERATSLFVRVHELVTGGALKLQAATEAASAGKLAAIAASAAAIAGGGAVVATTSATQPAGDTTRATHVRAPVPVAAHAPVRTGRATTAAPAPAPRRAAPRPLRRRPAREFAAATTARAEFRPRTTAVVLAGSPEPPHSTREFASEFGG